MLEAYRPILYALSLFIALWAQALLSNPRPPQGLELLIMGVGSLYLLLGAVQSFRRRARLTGIFLLCCVLLPPGFYLEMALLQSSESFLPERLGAVYTVYNVFRYLFLICAFLAVLKMFLAALGRFASEEPDRR